MNIKTVLKNILFLFFMLAANLCSWYKKEEKPTVNRQKLKKDKQNQLKNKCPKNTSQLFSETTEQRPAFVKQRPSFVEKINKNLNQPEQPLNHPQTTQPDQPDPGVVADIETIQKSSSPEEIKSIKQCHDYVVLFHGLSENQSTFYDFEELLEKALKERGWKDIKFIYPRSREGFASVRSLHVDAVFKEIKNKVGNARVHLIGYSQGASLLPKLEKLLVNNGNKVSSAYISGALGGIGYYKS